MIIQLMKLSDMTPADYHPRKEQKPGDKNYDDIKKSISEFGHVLPIVWNRRTGNIVGGHQTRLVLMSMGFEESDVSVVDLPLEKEKLLNLALNKIGSNPDLWDKVKLNELIAELQTYPVDVTLSGFNESEIHNILFDDIKEVTPPELKDGDKSPFIQMTFTLHDEQAEKLRIALNKAKSMGGGQSLVNENSNGNALTFIAEQFNNGRC